MTKTVEETVIELIKDGWIYVHLYDGGMYVVGMNKSADKQEETHGRTIEEKK